jgi:hypothetical protein
MRKLPAAAPAALALELEPLSLYLLFACVQHVRKNALLRSQGRLDRVLGEMALALEDGLQGLGLAVEPYLAAARQGAMPTGHVMDRLAPLGPAPAPGEPVA